MTIKLSAYIELTEEELEFADEAFCWITGMTPAEFQAYIKDALGE